MDPIAFHLGPLTIRWYGILFALGFLAGYQLLLYRARKSTLGPDRAANLTFAGMVAGVVGARLLYVIQNWSAQFRDNPAEIIRIDHGGLVFYGGFILGTLIIVVLSRVRKFPLGEYADLVAPALALAHAFGRVGCFLNGCCFGRVWHGPLAVTYPPGSEVMRTQYRQGMFPLDIVERVREYLADPAGSAPASCLPVFPVQLLESAANLAILALLLLVEKRLPRRGQLFAVYLVLYAASRLADEFLRGDYDPREYVAGLTPAQIICLVLFPVALALFLLFGRFGEARR